mmetsp:Transcript_32181/g.36152  ORF Transcript_32181/g.36152 Transcript_32181/m.36152 type:complete len:234 (-) Transcript_32181:123-824(-)
MAGTRKRPQGRSQRHYETHPRKAGNMEGGLPQAVPLQSHRFRQGDYPRSRFPCESQHYALVRLRHPVRVDGEGHLPMELGGDGSPSRCGPSGRDASSTPRYETILGLGIGQQEQGQEQELYRAGGSRQCRIQRPELFDVFLYRSLPEESLQKAVLSAARSGPPDLHNGTDEPSLDRHRILQAISPGRPGDDPFDYCEALGQEAQLSELALFVRHASGMGGNPGGHRGVQRGTL